MDGVYLETPEVIELAKLPLPQRRQQIAELRRKRKHWACGVVQDYMACMHVSLEELVGYIEAQKRNWEKRKEADLLWVLERVRQQTGVLLRPDQISQGTAFPRLVKMAMRAREDQ